jgi:hypothetical protein
MGYGFNMACCLVRNRPVDYCVIATSAYLLPPLVQRGQDATFVT